MIIIPQLSPEVLKDLEVNFGSTIAKAIWSKIVEHINWIEIHIPVGIIIMIHEGSTPGSFSWPLPAIKNNWQFCNGDPVVNLQSPLLGQNVPDLRDKFLKHGPTIGTIGGNATINLAHSHGGATGATNVGEFSDRRTDSGDGSDPTWNYDTHSHTISSSLGTHSLIPSYNELQPYMRIA